MLPASVESKVEQYLKKYCLAPVAASHVSAASDCATASSAAMARVLSATTIASTPSGTRRVGTPIICTVRMPWRTSVFARSVAPVRSSAIAPSRIVMSRLLCPGPSSFHGESPSMVSARRAPIPARSIVAAWTRNPTAARGSHANDARPQGQAAQPLPRQALAQNVREEAGRGPLRLPRPNVDSGQTKSDAVAETATRIVAKEQLRDRLLGPVTG